MSWGETAKVTDGNAARAGGTAACAVVRTVQDFRPAGGAGQPAELIDALVADTKAASGELAARVEQGRDRLLEMASLRREVAEPLIEQVRALGVEHELLETGLAELAAVVDGCAAVRSDRFEVEASLSLARGLDYYTGTVYETQLVGHESWGSFCANADGAMRARMAKRVINEGVFMMVGRLEAGFIIAQLARMMAWLAPA